MPTIMTHIISGAALGAAAGPRRKGLYFWTVVIVLSILPDLDVIAFNLGIPYAHPLGHRGFSHSFIFAALAGLLFAFLQLRGKGESWQRYWHLALVCTAAAVLHSLLDAMTSGGLGIGFFIPFENKRYFLQERPIKVSPIGLHAFLSPRGLAVMKSELFYVWIPSVLLLTGAFFIRRGTSRTR